MKHFERTLAIIAGALCSIREEEFCALKRDCADTLRAGGKLVATGLGKNVPICEKFVGTLNSVGIQAAFMHTSSALHGDLGIVRDGDLVIVLSKSGETSESVNLVRLLKKRSLKLWLLSFSRSGALCREIPNTLVMELEHEGDEWNILPNNSTAVNLIVLQELAMQLIKEERAGIDALRQNHPGGAIGERLAAEAKPAGDMPAATKSSVKTLRLSRLRHTRFASSARFRSVCSRRRSENPLVRETP